MQKPSTLGKNVSKPPPYRKKKHSFIKKKCRQMGRYDVTDDSDGQAGESS